MITLLAFRKDGTRRDIPLKSGEFTIGRNPQADLRIPLSEVSREHCRIHVNGNTVTIRDLNSSNGTYVNHHRVSEAVVKAGDEITVGPVTFIIQVDGRPTDVQPRPPIMPDSTAPSSTPTRVGSPAPAAKPAAPPPAKSATTAGPAKPATPAADDLEVEDLDDFDIEDLSDLDLAADGGASGEDDIMQYLAEDESSGEIPK